MKNHLASVTLALLALSGITFFACQKSVTTTGSASSANSSTPIAADVMVIASVQGRVVDESGQPITGAVVTSGTATATTDGAGVFTFRNISMSSRFGYVKAAKSGYFTGSRSIITNGAASNYINIQLIPRKETSSFAATSGGNIMVQSGDSASFPANAIVNASTNTAYTGTVHVFAQYFDPTDSTLSRYMPGDLRGIGSDGKETSLQSFGMLLVELQDDAGNKLQLASGQKATLTWAIPTTLQSAAPATIPLWYFNDSTGRWIEQGAAVRKGNSYVGTVSHFTFWNCDAPIGTVNFKAHFVDQHNNPLAYALVVLQSDSYGWRTGYTDSTGLVQGLIPKSESLSLRVMTECGTVIGGINIGPFLADQDMGVVTINITPASLTIKGTVVDCSNNPVDSGFVMAKVDGLIYAATVTKGVFTLPLTRCYNTNVPVILTAGDYKTSQTGNAATITANSGTVDAGQLSACGITISQYVNFSWNNYSASFTDPSNNIIYFPYEGILPGITSSNATQNLTVAFSSLTGTGSTNLSAFIFMVNGQGTIYGQGGTANITEFDTYAAGTFGGNLYDSISRKTYPLTGTFKVKVTP